MSQQGPERSAEIYPDHVIVLTLAHIQRPFAFQQLERVFELTSGKLPELGLKHQLPSHLAQSIGPDNPIDKVWPRSANIGLFLYYVHHGFLDRIGGGQVRTAESHRKQFTKNAGEYDEKIGEDNSRKLREAVMVSLEEVFFTPSGENK